MGRLSSSGTAYNLIDLYELLKKLAVPLSYILMIEAGFFQNFSNALPHYVASLSSRQQLSLFIYFIFLVYFSSLY
jgi:hypothetical protein